MGGVFRGLSGFAEEAEGQLEYLVVRSPAHARFLDEARGLIAGDDAVRAAIEAAWRDREFRARYERPLLVCAAVRFDSLRDPSHPLRRALGTEPPEPAAITPDAVRDALLRPSALASMNARFVQTNEVTRAVAWRWPLGLVARGRRAAIVDLGCSAGLNLVADRIDLAWNVDLAPAAIAARLGLDRAPIDLADDVARDWLRASIWPGQTARLARFEAASAAVTAARANGELALEARDAADMPARLDSFTRALDRDVVVCGYQTVVRDYLLPDVLARYDGGVRDWLLAHPGRTIWTELERAPSCSPGPAEIRAHVATRGAIRTLVLASGEFHPSRVAANAAAVEELTELTELAAS